MINYYNLLKNLKIKSKTIINHYSFVNKESIHHYPKIETTNHIQFQKIEKILNSKMEFKNKYFLKISHCSKFPQRDRNRNHP